MGLIREEKHHADLAASFIVDEREPGETRDPWRFVTLDIDGMRRLTPNEMKELGRWLMHHGERIGREYKSNGARRTTAGVNRLPGEAHE